MLEKLNIVATVGFVTVTCVNLLDIFLDACHGDLSLNGATLMLVVIACVCLMVMTAHDDKPSSAVTLLFAYIAVALVVVSRVTGFYEAEIGAFFALGSLTLYMPLVALAYLLGYIADRDPSVDLEATLGWKDKDK